MSARPIPPVLIVLAFCLGHAVAAFAQIREVDSERSTLTVYAYKSGLFSAFAHDHVISAPIARGSVSEAGRLSVTLAIRAADLKVLDPALAPSRRLEVQTRMLGSEVLDAAAHPEIAFSSTSVEPAAGGGWKVSGRLTLHGQTREVMFSVVSHQARYQGTVRVKQRDFGIVPVSIAGGTVKMKDEVMIVFDIAVR